ncbi:MAG: hypothetical protein FWF20_01685 [Betaproteobacteria bacterium]|nr:hypothetical protein [Betaproteobacteria bacterium]MCL2885494.1 hypothetical protein [Betaproteobacteria bacterium]
MNRVHRLLAALLLCTASTAMAADVDAWVGRYELRLMAADGIVEEDDPHIVIRIERLPDADPAKSRDSDGPDLARWVAVIEPDGGREELRRFRSEDYEGFSLPADGIKCLKSDFIIICKVAPGATVILDHDEKLVARTGLFGAILHVGVIELTKLD